LTYEYRSGRGGSQIELPGVGNDPDDTPRLFKAEHLADVDALAQRVRNVSQITGGADFAAPPVVLPE
jgi:hypothetical protein